MPKVTWLWIDELISQPRSLGFQSLYLFICPFFLPNHLNRIFLAMSSGAQNLFCPSAQPFLAYLMSSSSFFALKLHDGCLSSKYCVHTTEYKKEGNRGKMHYFLLSHPHSPFYWRGKPFPEISLQISPWISLDHLPYLDHSLGIWLRLITLDSWDSVHLTPNQIEIC